MWFMIAQFSIWKRLKLYSSYLILSMKSRLLAGGSQPDLKVSCFLISGSDCVGQEISLICDCGLNDFSFARWFVDPTVFVGPLRQTRSWMHSYIWNGPSPINSASCTSKLSCYFRLPAYYEALFQSITDFTTHFCLTECIQCLTWCWLRTLAGYEPQTLRYSNVQACEYLLCPTGHQPTQD